MRKADDLLSRTSRQKTAFRVLFLIGLFAPSEDVHPGPPAWRKTELLEGIERLAAAGDGEARYFLTCVKESDVHFELLRLHSKRLARRVGIDFAVPVMSAATSLLPDQDVVERVLAAYRPYDRGLQDVKVSDFQGAIGVLASLGLVGVRWEFIDGQPVWRRTELAERLEQLARDGDLDAQDVVNRLDIGAVEWRLRSMDSDLRSMVKEFAERLHLPFPALTGLADYTAHPLPMAIPSGGVRATCVGFYPIARRDRWYLWWCSRSVQCGIATFAGDYKEDGFPLVQWSAFEDCRVALANAGDAEAREVIRRYNDPEVPVSELVDALSALAQRVDVPWQGVSRPAADAVIAHAWRNAPIEDDAVIEANGTDNEPIEQLTKEGKISNEH